MSSRVAEPGGQESAAAAMHRTWVPFPCFDSANLEPASASVFSSPIAMFHNFVLPLLSAEIRVLSLANSTLLTAALHRYGGVSERNDVCTAV